LHQVRENLVSLPRRFGDQVFAPFKVPIDRRRGDPGQLGGLRKGKPRRALFLDQTKFIASLLGGPASFSDERLEQVHRHLNITDADFDEMEALLAEALEEHGVDATDVRVIGGVIESKRALIVARRAA
jgi:hemoglobin